MNLYLRVKMFRPGTGRASEKIQVHRGMKTLILKEWKERRLLFCIVTGLTILIHAALKLLSLNAYFIYPLGLAIILGIYFSSRGWRRIFFIALALIVLIGLKPAPGRIINYVFLTRVAYFIYPLGLAIVLGIASFQRDFIKEAKDARRESPWELRKIFWIRYFSGLVILLVTLFISCFHSLLIFRFRLLHFSPHRWMYDYCGIAKNEIILLILLTGILYTANCLLVLLTRKSFVAIICSFFLLYFFILILAGIIT